MADSIMMLRKNKKVMYIVIYTLLTYPLYYPQVEFILDKYGVIYLILYGINLLILNKISEGDIGIIYSYLFYILSEKIDYLVSMKAFISMWINPIKLFSTILISFLNEILLSLSMSKKNLFRYLYYLLLFLISTILVIFFPISLPIFTSLTIILLFIYHILEKKRIDFIFIINLALTIILITILHDTWIFFYNIPLIFISTKTLLKIKWKNIFLHQRLNYVWEKIFHRKNRKNIIYKIYLIEEN